MPNDDAKAHPDISVNDELDPADVAVITDGLRAYDLSQTGYYDFRPLAVFVRDPQTVRRQRLCFSAASSRCSARTLRWCRAGTRRCREESRHRCEAREP